MSNTTYQYGDNSELSVQMEEHEFGDGLKANKKLIAQLNAENESYKQEIHQLQRRLETNVELQNELQETIDSQEEKIKKLQASISEKLRDVEEKNAHKITDLSSQIGELQIKLENLVAENAELQKKYKEVNEKLLSTAAPAEVTIKHDNSEWEEKLHELKGQLYNEKMAREGLQVELKHTHDTLMQLHESYNLTKQRLAERDETLQSTRDELTECRIELENLKISPADQQIRGNSLFAEVEDRRQKALNTIATLKQSNIELKRGVHVKDNEIKALKAEKAALLMTLKTDQNETIQQHANLIENYKDKISELKFKFESLQKKYHLLENQTQPANDEYEYYQNLLEVKQKQIEELTSKIENTAFQALFEEGQRCDVSEQMRVWRYKAMTKEAQLKAIESRLEVDSSPLSQELLQIVRQDKIKNIATSASITHTSSAKNDNKLSGMKQGFELQNLKTTEKNLMSNAQATKHDLKPRDIDLIDLSSPTLSNDTTEFNALRAVNECTTFIHEKNKSTKKGILKVNCVNNVHIQGITPLSFLKIHGDEKKALRFTEDTVDPKPTLKKPPKQFIPNYPIIHVSSTSSVHHKDDEENNTDLTK